MANEDEVWKQERVYVSMFDVCISVSVLLHARFVSGTPELFHPAVNELWLQHTGHKGAQKLPVPSENGPSNIDEFIFSPFWCCVECTLMEFNWSAFQWSAWDGTCHRITFTSESPSTHLG